MAEQDHRVCNTSTDIIVLSASEIAQRIRVGELSAREVVEAHIQRIKAINPELNAMVADRFEQALVEADAADSIYAKGEQLGPLHGVPITIKDQFMVAGLSTTWGLPSQRANVATKDGPLVKRLRRAGAIILGKTNVPQLLAYHESDNPLYHRTNNPWNLKRTPGGSSGGETSLIAAHGSALGLGADIGGSIRIPAHFCGLHGLKPTSGRLTNLDSPDNLFPFGQETILAQPGPLARSVADLALAMNVLAAPGQEKIDTTIAPVPWDLLTKISLSSLRVAMYTDDGFFPVAPALQRAVYKAADILRAQGATVEVWRPPDVLLAMHLFAGVLSADGGAYVKRTLGKDPRDFRIKGFLQMMSLPNSIRPALAAVADFTGQRLFTYFLLNIHNYSTSGYMQLIAERTRYRTRFIEALDAGAFDIIICPPHALPALTHGSSYFLNCAGSYSILYNLLGMPAGTVAATRVRLGEESDRPLTCDVIERTAHKVEVGSAGLPVGVQVVGRYWCENMVLAVMALLEEQFRKQDDYPQNPPI